VAPTLAISKNDYYIIVPLMTPGLDASANEDNYPFYIGQVKGHGEKDAENNTTSYRVQFLEPATHDNGKTFNTLQHWKTTKYQTAGIDNLPTKKYDLVEVAEFCQLIKMNGGGPSTTANTKKRKRKQQVAIQVNGDYGQRAAEHWGIKLGKGRNVQTFEGSNDYY
jgi:hypothetical protein